MAIKDSELRIHDTLQKISELLGPVYGPRIRQAIDSYLDPDFSSREVREISDAISIGGWHLTGLSDTEKTQRHLRRALLLWYRTRVSEELAGIKTRIKSMSIDALKEELKQIAIGLGAPDAPQQAGSTLLSDSFGLATPDDRIRSYVAVMEAQALLKRVLPQLSGVRRGAGPNRTNWEKWFGAFDVDRFQTVQKKFEAMNLAIHTKAFKLYYRGSNWAGNPQNDLHGDNAAAQPLAVFGQWPGLGPTAHEPGFIHVLLGTFFFGHHTAKNSNPPNTVSRAGTILHELSHAEGATKDEVAEAGLAPPGDVHMYGPTCCRAHAVLTTAKPLNKCANNADSYRLFCEEFR